MNQIPRSPGRLARATRSVYFLRKETGTAGSTIYVEGAARQLIRLESLGLCVRYGTKYQPLHPAEELISTLRQLKREGCRVALCDEGRYFNPVGFKPRPFLMDWEKSYGTYPQAWYS